MDSEVSEHRRQNSRKTAVPREMTCKEVQSPVIIKYLCLNANFLMQNSDCLLANVLRKQEGRDPTYQPPLLVFKTEVHSLLTHKAYR